MPPLKIDSDAVPEDLFGPNVNQDQSVAGGGAAGAPAAGGGGGTPAESAGGTQAFAPKSVGLRELAGVSARLSGVAGAGVDLAKRVLWIAAGSILLLTVYLIFMDLVIGRDVHNEYQQILNPNRIGSEFYALGRLEQLSVDLNTARKDPEWQMSADSRQNADSILKMIGALPSVTSAQKAQLNGCVPPPATNASRNDKLDRCIGIVENIRLAALEAAAGATNAQVAGESASKINEHRQSLHTFWIQVAQLILLNLLLPLLTALLGTSLEHSRHSRRVRTADGYVFCGKSPLPGTAAAEITINRLSR